MGVLAKAIHHIVVFGVAPQHEAVGQNGFFFGYHALAFRGVLAAGFAAGLAATLAVAGLALGLATVLATGLLVMLMTLPAFAPVLVSLVGAGSLAWATGAGKAFVSA